MKQKESAMLECVFASPRVKVDVIFVHGLGGDGRSTWDNGAKDGSGFWPLWLSEDIHEVRIWTLHYPAPLTEWAGSRRRAMPLADRAVSVLDLLKQHGLGEQPVVFIGHSLGGLLIKQILREAESRVPRLMEATRGVVFIGTPHSGSTLANLAEGLERISYSGVAARFFFRWSSATRALRRNCPHLRDLGLWYRDHARKRSLTTLTYFETVAIGPGLVVDQSSADPGAPDCTPVPLDGNHFQIAKPLSRQSQLVMGVGGFVRAVQEKGIDRHQFDPEALAFLQSHFIEADELQGIHQLNSAVFKRSDLVPEKTLENWWYANPISIRWVRTRQGRSVGYSQVFPLKPDVFTSLMNGDIVEAGIRPEDILNWASLERGKVFLYIPAVATWPEARNHSGSVIFDLLSHILAVHDALGVSGILALAVSSAPLGPLVRFGFQKVFPETDPPRWAIVGGVAVAQAMDEVRAYLATVAGRIPEAPSDDHSRFTRALSRQ